MLPVTHGSKYTRLHDRALHGRAGRGDAAAVRDPDERLPLPRRRARAGRRVPAATRCSSTATTATSSRARRSATRSSTSPRCSRRCWSTTTGDDRTAPGAPARAAAGRAALALAGCGPASRSSSSSDITGATFGRDFALTDHTGKPRTLADFRGKAVVLFFGYTQCPDVCPTTLADARRGDEAARPRRRPRAGAVRHRRSRARHAGAARRSTCRRSTRASSACYGDAAATERVAKEFKVIYQKQPGATPGSYTMDHSAGTFVFDPQGRLRLYVELRAGRRRVRARPARAAAHRPSRDGRRAASPRRAALGSRLLDSGACKGGAATHAPRLTTCAVGARQPMSAITLTRALGARRCRCAAGPHSPAAVGAAFAQSPRSAAPDGSGRAGSRSATPHGSRAGARRRADVAHGRAGAHAAQRPARARRSTPFARAAGAARRERRRVVAQHAMALRYACAWRDSGAAEARLAALGAATAPDRRGRHGCSRCSPLMAAALLDDPQRCSASAIANWAGPAGAAAVPARRAVRRRCAERRARGRRPPRRPAARRLPVVRFPRSRDGAPDRRACSSATIAPRRDRSRTPSTATTAARCGVACVAAFDHWRRRACAARRRGRRAHRAPTGSTCWSTSRATRTARASASSRAGPAPRSDPLPGVSGHARATTRSTRWSPIRSSRRRAPSATSPSAVLRLPALLPAPTTATRPLPPAPARARRRAAGARRSCSRASTRRTSSRRRSSTPGSTRCAAHGDAVLWLAVPHAPRAGEPARARPCARGVAAERLVFAPHVAAARAHRAAALRRPGARRAAVRFAHDRQRRAVGRRSDAHLPREHVRRPRRREPAAPRSGDRTELVADRRSAATTPRDGCGALRRRPRAARGAATASTFDPRRERAAAVRHRRRSRRGTSSALLEDARRTRRCAPGRARRALSRRCSISSIL